MSEKMLSVMSVLQIFTVTDNLITEIRSGTFSGTEELMKIDLESNIIEKVETGVFDDCPKLEYLNLKNNRITRIESSLLLQCRLLTHLLFGGIEQETAQVTTVKIPTVRNEFFTSFHNLLHLQFRFTIMSEFNASTFENLKSVQNMELEYNDIYILPDGIFRQNGEIESLVICFNKISFIGK